MEEGCTCIAVKERELAERTGYLKLYDFPEGEDEDGNPCPLHDPRKKTMSSETQDARRDRGEQLRALVVSWAEDKTFLLVLNEQQREIEEGKLTLNPEWEQVADEILGGFMAQPANQTLTAWDGDGEDPNKQDDSPKLILPQ